MSATSLATATDTADELLRFGPFTLQPAQRVVMEGTARVQLGSRAFDILILLLERAGSFVTKDEILQRVWPRSVVVEGNLRVHVAALRKVLGDGHDGRRYIVNVPNRGYSFVAPLTRGVADCRDPRSDRGMLEPALEPQTRTGSSHRLSRSGDVATTITYTRCFGSARRCAARWM